MFSDWLSKNCDENPHMRIATFGGDFELKILRMRRILDNQPKITVEFRQPAQYPF